MKWWGEVGNALHSSIKVNLPLVTMKYHTPFCELALPIYKHNMQFAIVKCKAWQDGQDASHMALIDSNCVYKGFTTSSLVNGLT